MPPKGRKRKVSTVNDSETNDENATATLEDEAPSTTTLPTKTIDCNPPAKRKPRAKSKTPALSRASSTTSVSSTTSLTPVECDIPWPTSLVELEKTHRALNLVFTFCCTRKHLATTFETIQSTVESQTKRKLSVEDVAKIVALRNGGIRFQYVDEASLQVDVRGVEDQDNFRGDRARSFQSAIEEQAGYGERPKESGTEVLFFEFIDGDLKREVIRKREAAKPNRKPKDEDLKMPIYSQMQMMGLIEKRNTKFKNAVNSFLNRCQEEGVDPEMKLEKEAKACIPHPTVVEEKDNISTLPKSIPKERKAISEIIKEIEASEWYTQQIVPDGHRVFDSQEAVYGDLNFQLSQDLVNALYNTKNITQLYAHQSEAINNLHAGHNVVVATSTSSGKSLIYQLPVLHELEKDPNTRAMYIFPTKALAQDQRRSLKEMMKFMTGLEETIVETFDGDTAFTDRNIIRDEGRIIFTNPDMLHITILPQEEKWRTFLKNLKFVVVDEIHVYNGLFGSHVAFIMRRLRRICAALGNNAVQFISCSATVANPREHFKTIFGVEDVKLSDFDGSPSGRKEFLCWNTPFKDPADPSSGRGDTMAEGARLLCALILRGVRVIAFCRVRKSCEALVGAVKTHLEELGRGEVVNRVQGYRGGYTPQDRRRIEAEMFQGKLMGIIATTALELGVDIGSLDAVITVSFPYSIANLRQQSGRAGRRNKDSLSVLIGDCFPTDQHYMQNPSEIFTKPNCSLQVDLENLLVLEGHIQCAAHELPILPSQDEKYFGAQLKQICASRLDKDGEYYHTSTKYLPTPSHSVAIRDTEDEHFAIINTTAGANTVLEELEASRAFFTIYDGAIFLHQGNTYLVKEFLPDRKMARVERVNVDWTTQQRDFTDIDPVETESIRRLPGSLSRAYYGRIKIVATVFGYFKFSKKRQILDAVEVDNPPIVRWSKGMWLDVPKFALDILVEHRLSVAGAIHAAEHAVLSLLPTYVVSMPGDVRTECKVPQKEYATKQTSRKRPARLTFYDAKGGASGSGISTKAFEYVDLLLNQALERIDSCGCHEGCTECVRSELCKHGSEVIDKTGAGVVIKALLGKAIDIDALPWGPEESVGIETVVLADPVLPRGRTVQEVAIKRELRGGGIHEAATSDEGVIVKSEPVEQT